MENNITTHVYKINARSLLSFKPDELWDNLYGKIELTFDDGKVINTNSEEVIFSRYFWETHVKYPKLPLLYTHFITEHYDKGMLNSKSHTSLLSTLSHDLLYLVFRDNAVPSVIEKSLELFYDIINNLYNGLVLNTAEYGTSIDIVDFIEVMHNKKITDSIEEVKKDYGPDNVANVFKVTKDVILNDESLDNNMLIKSARNGTISLNQLLQCVGIRGYVTELDSKQFEFPMARGFAKGFSNIYNIAVESRSGAKALFFSDSALQDSEYFARRLQLLTMPVERIVYTDCGSTDYLLWTVKGSVVEDGKQVYDGDLPLLVGKYYLNEKTNKLEVITKDSLELVGKTIKLRSSIHCKTEDKHDVCNVCFGELSRNIGLHVNIGCLSSALMTLQITQSLLSTKHLDFSAVMSSIMLSETDAKYFRISRDGGSYILQKWMMKKDIKLLVSQKDAKGLTNIFMTDDITRLNPSRLVRIDTITLVVNDDIGQYNVPIEISRDNKKGMFSLEFIQYIKDNGYTSDDNGNFVFDLSKWRKIKPIFILPKMEYNYSAHGSKIARMIEQTVNTLGDKKTRLTQDLVVSELFDLVNSKLFVNLSFLEIMVYAAAVPDPSSGNYDLSRHYKDPVLQSGDKVISNRSLSGGYAFKALLRKMYNPRSFSKTNRPDSPLDVFIKPNEVLMVEKNRER